MANHPFQPATAGRAYEEFLPDALVRAREQRPWTQADGRLPAMFVSHGAPPVLDDEVWLAELNNWGMSIPKPRAILIISAHWENAPLAISATDPNVPLYYDFGGFDPYYYTVQYRSPAADELAQQVAGKFSNSAQIHQWTDRGLDHGAFIPLMAMFPLADIPVLQLSMPSLNPADLLTLGEKIKSLRDEGVLVIGSGFMTHWLGMMRIDPANWGTMTAFNADFDQWVSGRLAAGDVDSLVDFRAKGPANSQAHPTADHFVPLLLTLGAADDISTVSTEIEGAVFTNSKRSIQVQ